MRVFLAERDVPIGAVVFEHLTRAGFLITGPIENVTEATRLAQSEAWDGAVCGLNLIGGRTDRILENLLKRQVPVIMTTAVAPAAYPDCAAEMVILEKPYDLLELVDWAERHFLKARATQ